MRADACYFARQLARAALFTGIEFAIVARRIAPLWRLLDGLTEVDWTDPVDMPGAQVAVADYTPNWWPATTRLLIRRVRLDVAAGKVSADPRARRRRTLHPDQRALPFSSSPRPGAVCGCRASGREPGLAGRGSRPQARRRWGPRPRGASCG